MIVVAFVALLWGCDVSGPDLATSYVLAGIDDMPVPAITYESACANGATYRLEVVSGGLDLDENGQVFEEARVTHRTRCDTGVDVFDHVYSGTYHARGDKLMLEYVDPAAGTAEYTIEANGARLFGTVTKAPYPDIGPPTYYLYEAQ